VNSACSVTLFSTIRYAARVCNRAPQVRTLSTLAGSDVTMPIVVKTIPARADTPDQAKRRRDYRIRRSRDSDPSRLPEKWRSSPLRSKKTRSRTQRSFGSQICSSASRLVTSASASALETDVTKTIPNPGSHLGLAAITRRTVDQERLKQAKV